MLLVWCAQFELNLTKKSKKKKKEKKEKKEAPAPAPEPAPAEDAKAAQEARLAKLNSGPAPGVAEDGLAIQDEKTVVVEDLNPLTPEVRRGGLRTIVANWTVL
jgi:hypothetical protein